jgi:MFS family permease
VIFAQPALSRAVIAGAAATLTMAGSMPTMGLELHHRGHDVADISIALGAHYIGMYALAPFGGRLVDRLGGQRALVVGLLVLGAAVVGIIARDLAVIVPAMFFVGVGWNIAFIGATTLVANGTRAEERALALGAMDLVTVTAGALGSGVATAVLAAYGVGTIVALAVLLAVGPALLIVARGRATLGAPAT